MTASRDSTTFLAVLLIAATVATASCSAESQTTQRVAVHKTTDGGVYRGAMKAGVFHGKGRIEWAMGATSSYEGEFRSGRFHGIGKLQTRRGDHYEGEFARGVFHGRGRYVQTDGVSYEGEFQDGEFTGHGVNTSTAGFRHEGQFSNWRPSGNGRLTDPSGTVFEGRFGANGLEGRSSIRWSDGSSYEGESQGTLPHGQGVLRRASGDVYRGAFEWGEFHGEGELTRAKSSDGVAIQKGEWQFGRFKPDDDARRNEARSAAERALYRQPALLKPALDALAPSDPSRISMYLLAIAGDGSQEVFRREVDFVQRLFDTDMGTQGRSVVLVNSRHTADSRPMASRTAIREAITAIAAKMDKNKDILFLFATSHGSKGHELSLGLSSVELPPLSSTELGALLRESGIRHKVVVISACYAGGFIEPLRNAGTMVITAARHDRTSFGCADENDFTYFGRAYFKEALPKSSSFQHAFERASELVHEWEKENVIEQRSSNASRSRVAAAASSGNGDAVDSAKHSLPQISVGADVARHVSAWWAQRSSNVVGR